MEGGLTSGKRAEVGFEVWICGWAFMGLDGKLCKDMFDIGCWWTGGCNCVWPDDFYKI